MSRLSPADRDRIEAAFDRQLAVGLHHGAQLAVFVDGDLAVDLAGGTTGPDGDDTTTDTRHLLFSCTKPYVAVGLHRLVERGDLAYDDPVVDHWPGFADGASAKADVTVRQVLSHTSGVNHCSVDDRPDEWGDWAAVVESVEAADPTFAPGERPAYHTFSFGWIVGELVRRVSGRPVEAYVADHVFDPLGMDRTSIGLRDDDPDDVATLSGFEMFDRCRDPGEGLGIPASESAALFNEEAVHRAVVPAATGIGTARDTARFYACLANGGALDGTRLLDEATVAEATATHAETDEDGTLSRPARYALGFWTGGLANDMFGSASHERMVGHAGLGSVFGWADLEANVSFAYVTNGIREESWEHAARLAGLSDAVRLLVD
jgi:CubicO group peptidase (beta-lactamase class C family)